MDPSQVFLDSQALFCADRTDKLHKLFQSVRVMSKFGRPSFGSEK